MDQSMQNNCAQCVINLLHAVEPAHEKKHQAESYSWAMHRAHDVYVTPGVSKKTTSGAVVFARKAQSGFVVLARLWQVCKNEGLRRYLRADAVLAVERAVQVRLPLHSV